ncbi:MAG: RNA polymerase sigma factor [Gemmataceae bacterium]
MLKNEPPTEPWWERYRAYLTMLARLQIRPHLRSKMDASDVVQQTFLDVHQAQGQLRGQTEAEQVGYLRRMLTNNLIDAVRKFEAQSREVSREQSLQAELQQSSARLEKFLGTDESSPSQNLMREEQLRQLAEALALLPDDQRLAVECKHLHGLSVAEISQLTGKSETAVGGLLCRGIRKLRQLLIEAPTDGNSS